mgnify:CR=1 FL=1
MNVKYVGLLLLMGVFGADRSATAAEPIPAVQEPRTFARFVPERADDFAWENDKVAFRVYGPALRKRPEDSGIDCWLKRVDYPVIDRWYIGNVNKKSYHVDHGEGYDPYHVGGSRGCGGLGLWIDGRMVTSDTYTDWKIIKSEPQETVFVLTYEWSFNGADYREEKQISIKMGDRFFSAVSTFWKDGSPAAGLPLAGGLTTHDGKASVSENVAAGWMACWEKIDDFGLGTGVMMDPARIQEFKLVESEEKDESHALLITAADAKGQVTYRAGYGWEKAGEIKSAKEWNAYLSEHAVKK